MTSKPLSPLWTEYQDNELRRMASEGKTSSEIGNLLNRTKNSIDQRRYLLRKKSSISYVASKWTKERVATLCAAVLEGKTTDDLAAQFGVTPKAILARVAKARDDGDLPPRGAQRRAAIEAVCSLSREAAPEDDKAPAIEFPAERIAMPPVIRREWDDHVRERITACGLTGGLLGDPLPGRSALDQRRRENEHV